MVIRVLSDCTIFSINLYGLVCQPAMVFRITQCMDFFRKNASVNIKTSGICRRAGKITRHAETGGLTECQKNEGMYKHASETGFMWGY